MSNSSIWPINRTLSGATTPGLSGPGSDGNERVLCIPYSSSITEASLSDYLMSCEGQSLIVSLTSLQRCSWYIVQPQPTGPQDTRWEWVLPLCRDVVGILYSQGDWATGDSLGVSLTSLQRCSWYIVQSQVTGPQDTRSEWVLPLCRDVVGILYSPRWLGHRHSFGVSLTSLQRYSRYIVQSQVTGPQDTRSEWVLPLCRDVVGILYSPRWLGHRTLVRSESYLSTEM